MMVLLDDFRDLEDNTVVCRMIIPAEAKVIRIQATVPCVAPPSWAVWERRLLEALDQSVYPFLTKYTHEDGTLIYRDDFHSSDSDDFYESFYNWPLLYLLGGGDHLLPLAHRQYEATTRLLTRYGNLYKEYERGCDQFHQQESWMYFYLLCLADPTHPRSLTAHGALRVSS